MQNFEHHAGAMLASKINSRDPRHRTLKSGLIKYANGSITANCVVRDLSTTGAKLKIDTDILVPDRFQLEIPMDSLLVNCVVRWRAAHVLGIQFEGPMEVYERRDKQVVQPGFNAPNRPVILRR